LPKATFFNLSQSKRDRIINAAISEFSEKNYHQVSVSSIVRRASIPKGSFYQYFEDKKDLYRHIVDLAYRKKMEIMSGILSQAGGDDVFSLLRTMIDAGVEMAKTNSDLSAISSRMMADPVLYREIMDEYDDKAFEFMRVLVDKGIAQGDISEDIDPGLVSRFVLMAAKAIGEEISASGVLDLDVVRERLYSFVDIIEYGLRRKKHD